MDCKDYEWIAIGMQRIQWACKDYNGIAKIKWDCKDYNEVAKITMELQILQRDCKDYINATWITRRITQSKSTGY